jgi:hypothetical protein
MKSNDLYYKLLTGVFIYDGIIIKMTDAPIPMVLNG